MRSGRKKAGWHVRMQNYSASYHHHLFMEWKRRRFSSDKVKHANYRPWSSFQDQALSFFVFQAISKIRSWEERIVISIRRIFFLANIFLAISLLAQTISSQTFFLLFGLRDSFFWWWNFTFIPFRPAIDLMSRKLRSLSKFGPRPRVPARFVFEDSLKTDREQQAAKAVDPHDSSLSMQNAAN